MSKSLAIEWAERGVRVNCVAPGPFESDGAKQNSGLRRSRRIRGSVPMGRSRGARWRPVCSAVASLRDRRQHHHRRRSLARLRRRGLGERFTRKRGWRRVRTAATSRRSRRTRAPSGSRPWAPPRRSRSCTPPPRSTRFRPRVRPAPSGRRRRGLRSGGRIYVGAGTSGRLGVLDATGPSPSASSPRWSRRSSPAARPPSQARWSTPRTTPRRARSRWPPRPGAR